MATQLEKSSRESTASNPAGDKLLSSTIRKDRLPSKQDLVESSSETTSSNPSGDALKAGSLKKRSIHKNSSGAADDFPTDEIAAAAHEIKDEINETTHHTQKRVHSTLKRIRGALLREVREIRRALIRFRHNIRYNSWVSKQISTSKHLWADLMSQSTPVKALFFAILFTNLIVPLFFLKRTEAGVVFCTYIVVSILSHFMYQNTASPDKLRSLALSHILWVPMLFWLVSRSGAGASSPSDKVSDSIEIDHVRVFVTLFLKRPWLFTQWIRSVLLVNSFALSVDALQMAQLFQEKTGSNLGVPGQPGTIGEKTIDDKSKQATPKFNQQTPLDLHQKTVKEIHHAAPTA